MARDLGVVQEQPPHLQTGARDLGTVAKPTFDQAQASLAQSQALVDKYHAEDAQYKAAAELANKPSTIAKETAKGTVNELFSGPVKALRSGVSAAKEFFTGQPDTSTFTDFAGNPQQTYQQEVRTGEKTPLQAGGQAALDVASFLPTGKALGLGAKAVEKVPGLTSKLVPSVVTNYLAKRAEKKATDVAVKALTPKMSVKETEDAVARGLGTVKGGKATLDMSKDKGFMDMVASTKDLVKGKSSIEDTNAVRTALKSEAESLAEKIAPIKQTVSSKGVKTWLDNIQKPIEIESDTTQSKKFDLTKQTLMKIVDKNLAEDSSVGSLLKSRKEFDSLVEKEFPNLYDRENAPFRSAVKAMRDALNNDIEANLPDGFGYKESLKKQRHLYEAIDNLSSQAPSEIKNTATWGQRHPNLKFGAKALGAYGAYETNKAAGDAGLPHIPL